MVTDGAMDRGVDAIYIDERFNSRVVHLFQFKHHSKFSGGVKNFPSMEVDKILSFSNDLLQQTDGFLETCNPILAERVVEIWEFIEGGSVHVYIHLCSNGEKLVPAE